MNMTIVTEEKARAMLCLQQALKSIEASEDALDLKTKLIRTVRTIEPIITKLD